MIADNNVVAKFQEFTSIEEVATLPDCEWCDLVTNDEKVIAIARNSKVIQYTIDVDHWTNESIDTYKLETYKVHPKIKKHINFEEKDVFDVLESLEDDSNTILFFRNALGHLSDTTARCFAEEASKKLKKGSLLVIGDYDKKWTFIEKHLHENGFTEIMNNVWQKDSKAVESFKKLTARLKKAGRSMNIVFKN